MNPGGQALSPTDSPTFAGIAVGTGTITFNDSTLVNDGTNILAQKNGTNAQMFRVYKTNTNAEWLEFNWQATADTAVIRTATNGGTARTLALRYGGSTATAISIPIGNTGSVALAGSGAVTTNAVGLVTVGGSSSASTSGALVGLNIFGGAAPTATSTLALTGLNITQTINYSNATPGAGTWKALNIAITETANPTGAKYMIFAAGGAAATTEVFSVTNAGELAFAGVSGDTDAKTLCKKADDTIGTCSSLVGADGTCTCS